MYQQMHMVMFAVELHQFSLKIPTDAGEDIAQVIENRFGEDVLAVFGNKDQMHMHHKNTVSSVANIVVISHRPSYTPSMQRLQAYKYELMPTGEQERKMRRFAGACRVVFNEALALQVSLHERGEKKLGYVELARLLTTWRHGSVLPSGRLAPWLAEAPTHPLQQKLKDLERAYTNFFAKRAAFPRVKKKGRGDSFRYPDPKQIKLDQENSRLFLPKLGRLRYRNSRDVLGEIKQVTVSASSGKWFVSVQTEREVEQPNPQAVSAVGIDMGIARFATFSDGLFLMPLNSFKKHESRLRHAQRAMSRKTKFSSNWKKAKARIQRIHTRIGNARRDYLHKATTTISQNHAVNYPALKCGACEKQVRG